MAKNRYNTGCTPYRRASRCVSPYPAVMGRAEKESGTAEALPYPLMLMMQTKLQARTSLPWLAPLQRP